MARLLSAAFRLLPTLALAGPFAFAAPLPPTDLPDIVERTLPGVVNVASTTVINYQVYGMDEFLQIWGIPKKDTQTSLGSGFVIDKDGFVLTNNHVVEKASEVMVTFSDKRSYRAHVVGKDEKTDLAILQIRDKGTNRVPDDLKPLPLGDSDTTRIGEGAFAVGEPFGLGHTVTLGIISAKNRTIGEGPFDNFLQTDASINPGNSGGPLLNLRGEVIGINTMIVSRTGQTAGLGFAIPINEAKVLIPELKRYGRIPRPWLGLLGERVTPQLKEYYDLPVGEGVIILSVVEGAPAQNSGLKQGDILVDMGELPITEPNDVERVLAKHHPKETIAATIQRGKKKMKITFKLEELPRLENLPKGII